VCASPLNSENSSRADIQELLRALGKPKPPRSFTQRPFDYDPSHYQRLCAPGGGNAAAGDLYDYALDLTYIEDIQLDLFRYVIPKCLQAWQVNLQASGHSGYEGFVEQFLAALAQRQGFVGFLPREQHEAIAKFMSDAILDKIDQENKLTFSGMAASPYAWINSIAALGTAFPCIPALWREWWDMHTRGQAYAVLQYASCLMYFSTDNPVFSPWSPERGGGPPCLWETGAFIDRQSWLADNVVFLKKTLSVRYVGEAVSNAAISLNGCPDSFKAERLAADFESASEIVAQRIDDLITILSSPLGKAPVMDWW